MKNGRKGMILPEGVFSKFLNLVPALMTNPAIIFSSHKICKNFHNKEEAKYDKEISFRFYYFSIGQFIQPRGDSAVVLNNHTLSILSVPITSFSLVLYDT